MKWKASQKQPNKLHETPREEYQRRQFVHAHNTHGHTAYIRMHLMADRELRDLPVADSSS